MLTSRMQAQAIANAISGRGLMTDERGWEQDLSPKDFTDPWKEAALAVFQAEPGQERQALITALKDHPERDSILAEVWAAEPPPRFPTFEELGRELAPITWVWQNWIPRGMVSLLGSVKGAGKSYVALHLAHLIVQGEAFPDGSPVSSHGKVIYVDAERIPQAHYGRLQAWGTDLSKIYPLVVDMLPDDHAFYIDLSEERDRDLLVEMAYKTEPELIIVDSMGSISTRGENTIEDVRQLLSFLVDVASTFNCGLLLLHHLRKRISGQAAMGILTLDDFRGSGHIAHMARSVLGLSVSLDRDGKPDRNATRRLEMIATNLVRYPEAIGVRFDSMSSNEEYAQLSYVDAPAIGPPEDSTKKGNECREWLADLLRSADEPMRPKDVIEMAEEEGFSRRMIYRQKKNLAGHIVDTEHNNHPDNCWMWQD